MPDHRRYPAYAGSQLPHVGTYRRVLPVGLERLYENALDWQHLPFVHSSSFTSIDCEDAGPWGWRAATTTGSGQRLLLELRLDRECRRWITRTLADGNAGREVWTHAFEVSPRRTDIVVDFFVPGVAAADRDRLGAAFSRIYEQLYDEDVAMMVERQSQLDKRIDGGRMREPVCLGAVDALSWPLKAEFGGRTYIVTMVGGELLAHIARCPHQLGPLDASLDGSVRCPWHGYRFDVKTGACLSGQAYRLPKAPDVVTRDGKVWLELQLELEPARVVRHSAHEN
jgi:nitrite reductase/ring-hydroxylating ferredoxin subunit